MRDRRWAYYLVAGCLLATTGFFLGTDYRRGLTELLGWTGVVVMFRLSRRIAPRQRRPWQALALSGACFMTGGILRFVHGNIVGTVNPYPSPGDPFYLAGYAALIACVVLLIRLRSEDAKDESSGLDALIVAASVGVVAWTWVFAPYVQDPSIGASERILSTIYSTMTLVLLGCTTKLAVGPGARTVSYYLLASAMLMTFVADVAASLAAPGRIDPAVSEIMPPFIYVFFAVAALHPDASRLTERPTESSDRLSWQRLLLLGGALLLAPALGAWYSTSHGGGSLEVVILGWVILAVLVLVRLTGLVRTKERTAWREHILGEANAGLVSSTTRFDMDRAALRAVASLCRSAEQFRASVATVHDGCLEIVDAVGARAHGINGTRIPIEALPESLRWGLAHLRSASSEATRPIDLPHRSEEQPRAVLVTPLVSQNELRGAMIVTTKAPLPPDIRRAIEQLSSMVSLAFETAALTEDLHRQQSERRFRVLVENSSDIVIVLDDDSRIAFASPACQNLLGKNEAELLGQHPLSLVHPDDTGLVVKMIEQLAAGNDDLEPAVLRVCHAEGWYRWFEIRARDLRFSPELGGVVVNAREISDRKEAEDELVRREARFRALVQHSSDLVMVLDSDAMITYVTPAVRRILGYEVDEVMGRPAADLLSPEEQRRARPFFQDLFDRAPGGTAMLPSGSSIELRLGHRDGGWRTLDITVNDLRHEPEVAGVVLNARDVTERKALEHDLRYQALHDSLTGLGNRAMFLQRTAEALEHHSEGLSVAALFIDLDDFKTVNDSLGHAFGDELLIKVADRLRTCLHHNDVAARLGGDEFAVLLQSPYGPEEVTKVAERILLAMRSPFRVQDRDIALTASIGIAHEDDSSTAEVLLRNADMAMYLAKERGKNRHEVFEEDMHASVFERLVLKADLAHGIEASQLRLCYQPIVSLETGRITGVEALVRWDHPSRGRLAPAAFVELAEDTGLIVPLGQWVLEEACRQLRTWQLRLPSDAALTMSVNLSVRQLEHDAIVDAVAGTIHQFSLDPSTITLELTETVLAESEVSQRRLSELRNLGVSLAVDDFGTGYSSLGYVQQFPIDIIKIDRSFVDQLGTDSGGKTVVVQTMIEMAQRLGVHTVAEGIEDQEQLRMLQFLGCDLGQGYYFSKPVPASAIGPLLTASIADGSRFLREPQATSTREELEDFDDMSR